jgi:hypothetical protein
MFRKITVILLVLAFLAMFGALLPGCGIGTYHSTVRTDAAGVVTEEKRLLVGTVLKEHAVGELDVKTKDASVKLKDASSKSNAAELLQRAAELAK